MISKNIIYLIEAWYLIHMGIKVEKLKAKYM